MAGFARTPGARLQAVDPQADPVIVAFDPGGTTGVAMFRSGGLPNFEHEFTSGQVEGRFTLYETWDDMVAMAAPLVVVAESYTITGATAQKSQQYDALYILGVLERDCRRHGFPFHLQTPAQAKAFATDEKLRAMQWYAAGQGHANDAARHLLRWLVSSKHPESVVLLGQIVDGLGLGA